MRVSRELARVVRRIVGTRSARDVAAGVGLSHSTVYDMLKGHVPSFRTVEQFAEGEGLEPKVRAELFTAAGFVAPGQSVPDGLSPSVAEVAQLMGRLSPERLDVVRALLEQPQRLDGVGLLLRKSDLFGDWLLARS